MNKNKPKYGQLIIDVICALGDIHYPIDLNLLTDQGKTDAIINRIYAIRHGEMKRLRIYRVKGR